MSAFSRYVKHHRTARHWTLAELARRSGLTQPEVSRVESGNRMPTLRHVRGIAEAFSAFPVGSAGEPDRYENWVSILVDLGERARIDARASKEKATDAA